MRFKRAVKSFEAVELLCEPMSHRSIPKKCLACTKWGFVAYRMNLDRIGTTSVAIACARVPLILLRDSTLS